MTRGKSAILGLLALIKGKGRGRAVHRPRIESGMVRIGPKVIGGLDFYLAKQSEQKEGMGL